MVDQKKIILKAMIWGLVGILGLLAFYLSIFFYFSKVPFSLELAFAFEALGRKWFLFSPLLLGFGLQVGLFSYLRYYHKLASAKLTATSGAASGASMVACCAHHLTEIFPLLGLASLTTALSVYQNQLLLFGIFVNFLGVLYLGREVRKVKIKYQKSQPKADPPLAEKIKYGFAPLILATVLGLLAVPVVFAHEGEGGLTGSSMPEMMEFMQGEMGENAGIDCQDLLSTNLIEAGETMMGGMMTSEQHEALEEKMEELSPDMHDRVHGMMGMWATGCVGEDMMAAMGDRYGYFPQDTVVTAALFGGIFGGILGGLVGWFLGRAKK